MRSLKIISILTIFFSVSFTGVPGAVFFPVNQPEHQFIYDLARRAEISGSFDDYNFNVAPYNFDRIELSYPLSGHISGIDQKHISAFAFLSEDFSSAGYARAQGYESIRGGAIARPHDKIYLYTNFLLDEKMQDDPDYTGKKWRGLAGEIENAFVAYSDKRMDIFLGRFSSFWGATDQSLVLSSTARPMDAFSFRFRWRIIDFTYQFAKLDRLEPPDSAGLFQNRYFAGHRLDFRPVKNLRIGLFETIVFGGPGRSVDLTYLNPIMFYHAVQLNEDVDDNTFLGLDFCWYINSRHKFYGQLMVDDMQVDNKAIGDQEPDEIGYMLGFHTLDLFDLLDLSARYLKITNRTYNQKLERNRYENRGSLIGHPFGPDGDNLQLTITRWFESSKKLSLDLAYQRRGEGRYDESWTEPWREYNGDYTEPFPTGVVEKNFRSSLKAFGFYKELAYIEFEAGLENIKNFENVPGDDRTIPFVHVRFSLIFQHLFKID